MARFNTLFTGVTTHGFIWHPAGIFFQSLEGEPVFPGAAGVINTWTYTGGSIPVPGNENARINLAFTGMIGAMIH